MVRRWRMSPISDKGSVGRYSAASNARKAVTLLDASLDLSGGATRSVVGRSYFMVSRTKRSDWQAIGGDFNTATSRARSRREVT